MEKPSLIEIWYRFPKFIIGFILASDVFSSLSSSIIGGAGSSGYPKNFKKN